MYLVVLNLCRDSHSPPPHPSSPQPASLEPQRLPSVEVDLNKNSAKSPGSAVLCRAEPCMRPLRCESREGGSSPKLCLSFYKKKTKVWGMDFSEVGAEFGSCGVGLRVNLIRILQNSPGSGEFLSGSGARGWLRWRSQEAGSSPKLCRIFYRRKTEVLGMYLSEVDVTKRGLEGSARVRFAGIRQLQRGQCLRGHWREVVREARG